MERRNTIQKSLVFDAVNRLRCHATAEEVYDFVKKEYPSISKATVYRNLNLLAEENKIRKIEIPGEPDRFDHIVGPHYHAKCIKCGKIFDIDADIKISLDSIAKANDFAIEDFDILFRGVCPKCKDVSD